MDDEELFWPLLLLLLETEEFEILRRVNVGVIGEEFDCDCDNLFDCCKLLKLKSS